MRFGNQPLADGRRDIIPDPPEGIGFRHKPEQFLGRPQAEPVLEHRQPQLQPGAKTQTFLLAPRPQVLAQDVLEVRDSNPAVSQLLAITVLGQVRLATKDLGSLFHRLGEGQLFQSVQCVVVDENRDRSLGRQKMGGMLDRVAKMRELGRVPSSQRLLRAG